MTREPHPMDVCNMFDTTNMTIAQVARHFGLTVQETKNILMEKRHGSR
jgi:hypothetical protein